MEAGSTQPRYHRWVCLGSLTDSQAEGVEGVPVDAVQLAHQGHAELHHDADVGMLPLHVLRTRPQGVSELRPPLGPGMGGDLGGGFASTPLRLATSWGVQAEPYTSLCPPPQDR